MLNDSFTDSFIVCERITAILRRIKRQHVVILTRLIFRNAPLAEDATLNLPCLAIIGRRLCFP